MTHNWSAEQETLKQARMIWRRRRGALQRHDSHYRGLCELLAAAEADYSEQDHQAGFYAFHNMKEQLDAQLGLMSQAQQARRHASLDLSAYEARTIGPCPRAE